jgi:hypothetical protein
LRVVSGRLATKSKMADELYFENGSVYGPYHFGDSWLSLFAPQIRHQRRILSQTAATE